MVRGVVYPIILEEKTHLLKEKSELIIYIDAIKEKISGKAGLGIIFCDTDENIIAEISRYLGENITRNEAEYHALIHALQESEEKDIHHVLVRTTNEIIEKQLTGILEIEDENVKDLYKKVKELTPYFKIFNVKHVAQSDNEKANQLAQLAIQKSEQVQQEVIESKPLKIAKEVIDIESEAITELKSKINISFLKAINIILNCQGRIIISGAGKSGIIGQKIAATLSSTGTSSFFMHPFDALHGDLGIVTRDDVIVLISKSGEVNEFNQLFSRFRRIQIPIIAITGNTESQLAKNADVVLDVSVPKEACPYDLAPTASTTATMVMGDCLAVVLLKEKGFQVEDFAFLHPGGNLGKQFTKVEDYMYTGEKVPIIYQSDKMKHAILVMTKNRGITGIVNEDNQLVGVITYGDLGRLMKEKENVFDLPVNAVMTKNPKTISKQELAIKAVSKMEEYGITALIVIDQQKKPIGIIHLHDLMREGVV